MRAKLQVSGTSIHLQPELRVSGTRAGPSSHPATVQWAVREANEPDLAGLRPGQGFATAMRVFTGQDAEAQRSGSARPGHTEAAREAAEQVLNADQRDPAAFASDITFCDTRDAEDDVSQALLKAQPGNDFLRGPGPVVPVDPGVQQFSCCGVRGDVRNGSSCPAPDTQEAHGKSIFVFLTTILYPLPPVSISWGHFQVPAEGNR